MGMRRGPYHTRFSTFWLGREPYLSHLYLGGAVGYRFGIPNEPRSSPFMVELDQRGMTFRGYGFDLSANCLGAHSTHCSRESTKTMPVSGQNQNARCASILNMTLQVFREFAMGRFNAIHQAWYRDQNPTNTSNFTDRVSVVFQ